MLQSLKSLNLQPTLDLHFKKPSKKEFKVKSGKKLNFTQLEIADVNPLPDFADLRISSPKKSGLFYFAFFTLLILCMVHIVLFYIGVVGFFFWEKDRNENRGTAKKLQRSLVSSEKNSGLGNWKGL